MPESLHRSPETITILLICYTPVQNGFGIKVKFKNGPHTKKSNLPMTGLEGLQRHLFWSLGGGWAQCSPHVSFLLSAFLPGSSVWPGV